MTTIELDTASAWVVFIIGVAAVLAQVVIAVTSLVVVPRNRRPQTALA